MATTPSIDGRNINTGVVTGNWTVSDPDGNPLTYTITGPVNGTVDITRQGATYTYSYTPYQSARLPAAGTPEADYDNFTVTFSDGRASVNVPVKVPILPQQLDTSTFITYLPSGSRPVAVVATESRSYIVNSGTNTLVVHGAGPWTSPTATIPVAANPTAVALNSVNHRAYVAANNAVTVINTDDNTVVATISTGAGQSNGVAVSPDGSRVYVSTATGGLKVINPATNTVTGTIQVGANPSGVVFSRDGRFAYVANKGSNSISVIDAVNNAVVGSPIAVGASPTSVAVTRDGRAYVTNHGSGTVSVIDTVNRVVVGAPISVGAHPNSVVLSPDDSLAYVGNDYGMFVINTRTNGWAESRSTNTGVSAHFAAPSPDGRFVYIADPGENSLRILSLVRGNTAPVPGAVPSAGTPEPILGAVTGRLNVEDPDGDWLSYRLSESISTGAVTFDSAAGTYTFTPTHATREQAAQAGGLYTVSFKVIASDSAYPQTGSTEITVTVPVHPRAKRFL